MNVNDYIKSYTYIAVDREEEETNEKLGLSLPHSTERKMPIALDLRDVGNVWRATFVPYGDDLEPAVSVTMKNNEEVLIATSFETFHKDMINFHNILNNVNN